MTDGDDDNGDSFLGNIVNAPDQLRDAKEAYVNAKAVGELPTDDEGRVRLVCRRYAEQRAVELDDVARPECYEEGHPDCEGCLEDVREGIVETW